MNHDLLPSKGNHSSTKINSVSQIIISHSLQIFAVFRVNFSKQHKILIIDTNELREKMKKV